MSQTLKLFSKQDCDLCDTAEQLIRQVLESECGNNADEQWQLEKVDIELVGGACQERYAWSIPVLMNGQNGEEIAWPFPPSRIRALIGR